jgi:hypothetical protein
MVGAVIAIVFNVLYPRADDPGSVAEIVGQSQSEGMWAFTHYALAWGVALTFIGLIVIARSFVGEPSASWARVALIHAIGGALTLFLALVILGFAVKGAAGTDGGSAEEIAWVAGGLFLASIGLFFGFTPLFYGIAVLSGDEYPSWLGWTAIVAGAVAVLTGTIVYFDGFSKTTDNVLFPISSILFTVWVGLMGYKLWQKTSQPAATVGP